MYVFLKELHAHAVVLERETEKLKTGLAGECLWLNSSIKLLLSSPRDAVTASDD